MKNYLTLVVGSGYTVNSYEIQRGFYLMNIKLIGHFPYSRQTIMSDILMEEDKVVQIDGTPIPPTSLSFDPIDLDLVDYGYKIVPTLSVGVTIINELRELGGLDKKSLEIWGVGTPHWSR